MNQDTKLQRIKNWAAQAKNGDRDATQELLKIFEPLILKISKRIYLRYKKIFPLDEIIVQTRCGLVELTVLHYTPDGKAHYPYFIKQSLHAHLVKIYRPIYTEIARSVPIENIKPIISDYDDEIHQGERIEICKTLIQYVNDNFDIREKEMVDAMMGGDIARNTIAKKYNISFTRMKVIHKRVIKKLKEYLSKIGITRNDI